MRYSSPLEAENTINFYVTIASEIEHARFLVQKAQRASICKPAKALPIDVLNRLVGARDELYRAADALDAPLGQALRAKHSLEAS